MTHPTLSSSRVELPAGYLPIAEQVGIALARIRADRAAKSILIIGPHGTGKTAILRELSKNARIDHFITIDVAASENCELPKMLIAPLLAALQQLGSMESAGKKTERSLRVLGSFIGTLPKKEGDDFPVLGTELGVADNGSLDSDFIDVFLATGEAGRECGTAIALFIADLQFVANDQLSALIGALHHCAQKSVPIIVIGAGLPQLIGQTGNAKSYAERLFEFHHLM